MRTLKQRWIDALHNPYWWMIMISVLFGIMISILKSRTTGETPHCWTCYLKERYVNTHNVVVTRYMYDIKLPKELGLTQRDIIIFEDSNSVIIDDTRMIGIIMECKIK